MVKEKMYKEIQKLKRQGFSKTEIGRELDLHPRTAAKYFRMCEDDFRLYKKRHKYRDKVLEAYKQDILELYERNEFKRLNMSAVYDYFEEKCGSLPCNEQTFRNFIGYLLGTGKLKLEEKLRTYTKVPELPPGKQMQLDFGQYRCRSGLKLYIFVALLSASRYKYVVFQDHPFKTKEVIHHLLDCFDYFGGIADEMVIDQDKLMVVSENFGDIIFTREFGLFIEELGIEMYVCRRADPESKGKVENSVKYVKKNFLGVRDFKTLEEANASVLKWLKRRANGKISQATRQIPAIMIEKERQALKPLVNSIFRKNSLIGREPRNVDDKGRISINATSYQLPSRYRNKKVDIYITRQKVFVFDRYSGEEIVSYKLSLIPGKLISKRDYQREKEKTSKELKSHVTQMFDEERWMVFVENNFKAFPRYVRDQCIEAKRYFGKKKIETVVLNQALEYCLENTTLSFSNLNDTYTHFEMEGKKNEQEVIDHFSQVINPGYQGVHKPFPVASRDVEAYKEFIASGGGLKQ